MNGDLWVAAPRAAGAAKLRLFCFPYSGAPATAFFPWAEVMPDSVHVCPVQLPGHGSRLGEPLVDRLNPLVERVAEGLAPAFDRPFAFFGHSMGALVAFELARRLRRDGKPQPVHLFVSGHGAARLPDRNPPLHPLPEGEFVARVRELNGTPDQVLEHPELRQIVVPILRADFAVCETYEYHADTPLACGITALGGLGDPYVTRADLDGWREETSGPFSVRVFPGDHFYLNTARHFLLQVLARELEQIIQSGRYTV